VFARRTAPTHPSSFRSGGGSSIFTPSLARGSRRPCSVERLPADPYRPDRDIEQLVQDGAAQATGAQQLRRAEKDVDRRPVAQVGG
jgi:hypothetical protein